MSRNLFILTILVSSLSLPSCRKVIEETKPQPEQPVEQDRPAKITGQWYSGKMIRVRANSIWNIDYMDKTENEKSYNPWADLDQDSFRFRKIEFSKDFTYCEKRYFSWFVVVIQGTWGMSADSQRLFIYNAKVTNMDQLKGIHPTKLELTMPYSSSFYKVEKNTIDGLVLSYDNKIFKGSRGGGEDYDFTYDYARYRLYLNRNNPEIGTD